MDNVCGLIKFFDKHRQLNEHELKAQLINTMDIATEVSDLIVSEYNDLPVETLDVFFRRAKLGEYGNPFGEMSGATIMLWFRNFYKKYWEEFYNNKEQQKHDEVKKTDEQFISAPESVQRLFNSFAGKGYRTNAECEKSRTVEQVRKDVLKKHMHLYQEMSVDEADRIIDNEIKVALMAEGIFEN